MLLCFHENILLRKFFLMNALYLQAERNACRGHFDAFGANLLQNWSRNKGKRGSGGALRKGSLEVSSKSRRIGAEDARSRLRDAIYCGSTCDPFHSVGCECAWAGSEENVGADYQRRRRSRRRCVVISAKRAKFWSFVVERRAIDAFREPPFQLGTRWEAVKKHIELLSVNLIPMQWYLVLIFIKFMTTLMLGYIYFTFGHVF